MDKISRARRSENMSRIRAADTTPERTVRRVVTSLGYRYRLNVKRLPGKPDLVFGPSKKVILVHGCFWHQHSDCREGRMPLSRRSYWEPKLKRNCERDLENLSCLSELGFKSLIIWECETEEPKSLKKKIKKFLSGRN